MGLDTNDFRHFSFTMESEDIYRLTEDKRGYHWKIDYPSNELANTGLRVQFRPQLESSWMRYKNQFQNTFNLSDVITTTIPSSNKIPKFGPAKLSDNMASVAYDALNFGLMDLKDIGVTWSNLNFTCDSNAIGYSMAGRLEMDDSGVPKNAIYSVSAGSGSYKYIATYYFVKNNDLPDYMPSRIKITFLGGVSPTLLSDYKIQKLITSTRHISFNDIALSVSTNTQSYTYTNNGFYHIKTNGMVLIGSNTQIEQSGLMRKRVVLYALAIVFISSLLFLLRKAYLTCTKNNKIQ